MLAVGQTDLIHVPRQFFERSGTAALGSAMIASNFFQERPVNQIVFHSRIRQHCLQFSGDPVNSVQMMAHGCSERASV